MSQRFGTDVTCAGVRDTVCCVLPASGWLWFVRQEGRQSEPRRKGSSILRKDVRVVETPHNCGGQVRTGRRADGVVKAQWLRGACRWLVAPQLLQEAIVQSEDAVPQRATTTGVCASATMYLRTHLRRLAGTEIPSPTSCVGCDAHHGNVYSTVVESQFLRPQHMSSTAVQRTSVARKHPPSTTGSSTNPTQSCAHLHPSPRRWNLNRGSTVCVLAHSKPPLDDLPKQETYAGRETSGWPGGMLCHAVCAAVLWLPPAATSFWLQSWCDSWRDMVAVAAWKYPKTQCWYQEALCGHSMHRPSTVDCRPPTSTVDRRPPPSPSLASDVLIASLSCVLADLALDIDTANTSTPISTPTAHHPRNKTALADRGG